MSLTKRYMAECVGTFLLVLVGTGAICLNDALDGSVGTLGISIAFGGIVTLMILWFGNVSGAHINPAVSIGFWVAKQLSLRNLLFYVGAQLTGALLASAVVFVLFPVHTTLGATLPSAGVLLAFLLEFVLTFLLMYAILWVANIRQAPLWGIALVVGTTVGLEAYFAGEYTGASMNPARSLGPALVALQLEHVWIYLVATTLGAWAAVGSCRMLVPGQCCTGDC